MVFIRIHPSFDLLRRLENQRLMAPACNTQHLRMVRITNNEGLSALFFRVLYQLLNFQHTRAGGIHNAGVFFLQALQNILCLPVGADDDRFAAG